MSLISVDIRTTQGWLSFLGKMFRSELGSLAWIIHWFIQMISSNRAEKTDALCLLLCNRFFCDPVPGGWFRLLRHQNFQAHYNYRPKTPKRAFVELHFLEIHVPKMFKLLTLSVSKNRPKKSLHEKMWLYNNLVGKTTVFFENKAPRGSFEPYEGNRLWLLPVWIVCTVMIHEMTRIRFSCSVNLGFIKKRP